MLENSPLETLAFNYLSFNFFNNLWTWLAVIFWRIRTPKPELLPPSNGTYSSDKPDLGLEVLEPLHADVVPARVPGNGVVEDVDGVTKGKMKFTLYYYDDKDEDDIDRECKESVETLKITEELWEEKEGRLGWWESWEKLLRTRTGENEGGWYAYQDLTVINGNVVRFWDEEFEFATFANGGIK